jgi:hypothetical protein
VPDSARTHPRLSARMEERRRELGIRWGDVTARGGPSVETMRAIRRGDGRPIKELTLAAIARGLGLPSREVEDLAGADEAEWPPPAEGSDIEGLDRFERAVVADPRLTDTEKAAAIQKHRELIVQELAKLGITQAPSFVRKAVQRAGSGDDAAGQRPARPA